LVWAFRASALGHGVPEGAVSKRFPTEVNRRSPARARWLKTGRHAATLTGLAAIVVGCAVDFDASRNVPKRASLGQELYGIVCDRVGAQALRVDVTGASFHEVCHANADGEFANKVKRSMLPPLRPSKDVNGKVVPKAKLESDREYQVGRVEALARRRDDLIKAFDAALPDIDVFLHKRVKVDPDTGCDVSLEEQKKAYLDLLAETMTRLIDLYNDGTVPSLTRAVGRLMYAVREDPEASAALARFDARQGYRPLQLALGVSRPALSYPRLFELANSLLRLFAADSDPNNPEHKKDPKIDSLFENHTLVPGNAHDQFQQLLGVVREELRVPVETPYEPLDVYQDQKLGTYVLSRPRSSLEIAQDLLQFEHSSFGEFSQPFITRRDARGMAVVPLIEGELPQPFVSDGEGVPKIDELGEFITSTGERPPAPFFAVGTPEATRDTYGRALYGGEPLYSYIDVNHTFMNTVIRDIRPLFAKDDGSGSETMLHLIAGAELLFGERDTDMSSKVYPPDPERAEEYRKLGIYVPEGVSDTGVTVKYRAFDPSTSPLVDLTYAIGTVLSHREADDVLALVHKLSVEKPELIARLVGLGLDIKAIADKYPEAWIPENSMFWDHMIETIVKLARTPNLLEDLVQSFRDPRTQQIKEVFAAYLKYRDELSYFKDPNSLENYDRFNSTVNLTTLKIVSEPGATPEDPIVPTGNPPFTTPVDRNKPDTGTNRSAFQRFTQLLHDANGLGYCTKTNARIPLKIEWPPSGGITVNLSYPNDFLVKTACAFVGASAPADPMPQCGILRFHDMAKLIVDVALRRAEFDIRDECLRKLLESPLNKLVGGPDAFLQDVSQLNGLRLQPTVGGVSRLMSFDTPYEDWGGYAGTDLYPQTRDFLYGLMDPVPSMLCDPAPFVDTDGTVMKLRTCSKFEDTLRYRDGNGLYPLEQMQFVELVQPMAEAFHNNGASNLFVELFDKLHIHWGSPEQTKEECDPSLDPSHARWCSQDGAVRYEPLLAEVIEGDLFATIAYVVEELDGMTIESCDWYDDNINSCVQSTEKEALPVLLDAVRVMIDPDRNKGLTDRHGERSVTLNDGSEADQVTPLYLMIDSFKGIDREFNEYWAETGDGERHENWLAARSEIVDTFVSVSGSGDNARFTNKALPNVLPKIVELLQSQVHANCPDRDHCEWAREELAKNLSEVIAGPTFATSMDVLEAVRKDPDARREIQAFLVYLLDSSSDNDAQATTLSAALDLLQILQDDTNLQPLYQVASKAIAPSLVDDDGQVVQRGAADALVEVLTRVFARDYEGTDQVCTSAVDPQRTVALLLQNLVTPMDAGEPTPIEVILSVIGDVNRADPNSTSKFDGADYQNIGNEAGLFFLDEASGLEQVWEVLRQATLNN
jgi:hypothetical protein